VSALNMEAILKLMSGSGRVYAKIAFATPPPILNCRSGPSCSMCETRARALLWFTSDPGIDEGKMDRRTLAGAVRHLWPA